MLILTFYPTVLAILLKAVVATSFENISRKGWAQLDGSKGFSEIFGGKLPSFDVLDSWRICKGGDTFHVPQYKYIKDYTLIIESLLDAASQGKGGELVFPAGNFMISAPIKIPAHTCLIGAGIEKTIIKLKDNARPFRGKEKGMFYCSKAERITMHALTIDGNKDNQKVDGGKRRSGISSELVNYLWFRNVRSRNHAGYGCKFSSFSCAILLSCNQILTSSPAFLFLRWHPRFQEALGFLYSSRRQHCFTQHTWWYQIWADQLCFRYEQPLATQ